MEACAARLAADHHDHRSRSSSAWCRWLWPRGRGGNAPNARHGRLQRHARRDDVRHLPDAGVLLCHHPVDGRAGTGGGCAQVELGRPTAAGQTNPKTQSLFSRASSLSPDRWFHSSSPVDFSRPAPICPHPRPAVHLRWPRASLPPEPPHGPPHSDRRRADPRISADRPARRRRVRRNLECQTPHGSCSGHQNHPRRPGGSQRPHRRARAARSSPRLPTSATHSC